MSSSNQKRQFRNGTEMVRLRSRAFYDNAFLPTRTKLKKRFKKHGTKILAQFEKHGFYLTFYDIDYLFPCKTSDGKLLTVLNAVHYYRKWSHSHHIKQTARIKHKYGLTRTEYDSMMKRPCESCGTTQKQLLDTNKRWKKNFRNHAVDHNHKTGQVRGTLCYQCNLSLGYMNDNPDTILGLFTYLVNKDNSIEYLDELNKAITYLKKAKNKIYKKGGDEKCKLI